MILINLDRTKAPATVQMTNQKAKLRKESSSGKMSKNEGNQE